MLRSRAEEDAWQPAGLQPAALLQYAARLSAGFAQPEDFASAAQQRIAEEVARTQTILSRLSSFLPPSLYLPAPAFGVISSSSICPLCKSGVVCG